MEFLNVPDDQVEIDDQLVCRYQGRPFTGVVYELWPNGETRSEVSYLDGIQEGLARDWYDSGALESEATYKDGSLHGRMAEWNLDGMMQLEATYELGVLLEREERDERGLSTNKFELTESHPNYEILQSRRRIARQRESGAPMSEA